MLAAGGFWKLMKGREESLPEPPGAAALPHLHCGETGFRPSGL